MIHIPDPAHLTVVITAVQTTTTGIAAITGLVIAWKKLVAAIKGNASPETLPSKDSSDDE